MNAALINHATFQELQANTGAEFVAELVDTFAEEAPQLLDEMRSALDDRAADHRADQPVHQRPAEAGVSRACPEKHEPEPRRQTYR